ENFHYACQQLLKRLKEEKSALQSSKSYDLSVEMPEAHAMLCAPAALSVASTTMLNNGAAAAPVGVKTSSQDVLVDNYKKDAFAATVAALSGSSANNILNQEARVAQLISEARKGMSGAGLVFSTSGAMTREHKTEGGTPVSSSSHLDVDPQQEMNLAARIEQAEQMIERYWE
ncbi:unnamed protein product, partial [Amoebophrya sp. A120]